MEFWIGFGIGIVIYAIIAIIILGYGYVFENDKKTTKGYEDE